MTFEPAGTIILSPSANIIRIGILFLPDLFLSMFNCFYSLSRFCSDTCDLLICTFDAYFIKLFRILYYCVGWGVKLTHSHNTQRRNVAVPAFVLVFSLDFSPWDLYYWGKFKKKIIINRNLKCTITKNLPQRRARQHLQWKTTVFHCKCRKSLSCCSSSALAYHSTPLGQKHRKTSGQTKRMTAGFRAGLEFKVGL